MNPHPMHHDSAYKTPFSHPEMVTELLRGYVREPWIDQLDFATLEKVNAHYSGASSCSIQESHRISMG